MLNIFGENDGEQKRPGKGFTSQRARKRIYFIRSDEQFATLIIRLDAKARLVLPLLIRDRFNIKPKDQVLLSVSAISENSITIVLAKAPENCQLNSRVFSKNGRYLESLRDLKIARRKGGNENE